MRKVVIYELISLDGVAEDPDEFITEWDDAMDANLGHVIGSQDTVILGRRSYEEWSNFWPTSEIEPFSSFINPAKKFIVTSRALDNVWSNATPIDGDVAEFVRELKNLQGGDIGVHASISVAQLLLRAGLADEVRLVIAPRIAGSGRKLFEDLPNTKLTLNESAISPSGYLLLNYAVTN